MIVLIDNGHGSNTSGKCSPDGKHREYIWARKFAQLLELMLVQDGITAQRIVTETTDISITQRVSRVNIVCREFGAQNVILVSIHNNAAASDGKWHDARGFSAHVSLNASQKSKALATEIAKAVEQSGVKVRKPLPSQYWWPQNLGMCRDTHCPAVLCENLFQDNRSDVDLLNDEAFCANLAEAYVTAIKKYIGK